MSSPNIHQFIESRMPLTQEIAMAISSHFEAVEIPRHEFFLKAGELSDQYLFLEQGFMRAFTFDTEGNDITTGFYKGGQMVFEVSSFFMRTRSTESIRALSDCKGQVINFETLNHLFHSLPEFREFGRSMLVNGFVNLKKRTLGLINETAEQRYEALMQNNPEIFQHAPLKHIASYLGITDTSLSRIRREQARKP